MSNRQKFFRPRPESVIPTQPSHHQVPKPLHRRSIRQPLLSPNPYMSTEISTTQWQFLHFGGFWAISQQRVDASTPNFTCVGTMSADVPPPPLGSIGPWGRGRGVKNLKNGGLICAAGSYHFYFLSVAKCGSICRPQTCAHSGVEPSRSAKAFPQGGPKNSNIRIFHHFETLRP